MPKKFTHQVKVRNYHIDSYGHVNNAQYLAYLEDARTDFMDGLGFDMTTLRRQDLQIIITRVEIDYRAPATLGDTLMVHGWYSTLASRKVTWEHEIVNQLTERLVAKAQVSAALLQGGHIVVIPSEIRDVMQDYFWPAGQARISRKPV